MDRPPESEAAQAAADAVVSRGNELFEAGDLHAARGRYEAALALAPAHVRANYNLGVVLQCLGQPLEAIRHYEAAIAVQPGFSHALLNCGNAFKDLARLDEAETLYRRALALDPRDAHALNNLGSVAQERGRLDEARRYFSAAASADPDFADPRLSLATLALRDGDFARGWDGYELRFRTRSVSLAPTSLPRASREDFREGRSIAVRRERREGLGDEILFSTLLPEIRATGARVVAEVDPRLLPAFRRSQPAIGFVAPTEAEAAFATCDAEIPLGSVAGILRRHREDFARQPRALLAADPVRVEEARAQLGDGFRVAISWRSFQGRGRKHIEGRKSFEVERFAALGAALVDVQYGDVEAERAEFDRRHPGMRREVAGLDRFNDLEGVLAAIEASDLVVTTSNVTAHLGGAIGKRTWLVYLGAVAPIHYWTPGADGRSLWYPSVEIVTSTAWTRWEQAFDALRARLSRERGA